MLLQGEGWRAQPGRREEPKPSLNYTAASFKAPSKLSLKHVVKKKYFCVVLSISYFEARFPCVAHASLELSIPLPETSEPCITTSGKKLFLSCKYITKSMYISILNYIH